MTTATCHCGNVSIQLASPPASVTECSCSICLKLGVLWAYYSLDQISIDKGAGSTRVYKWNNQWLEFHSCQTCGCTTHWVPADKEIRERMGVNARLIEGLNKDTIKIEYFDGGNNGCYWTG